MNKPHAGAHTKTGITCEACAVPGKKKSAEHSTKGAFQYLAMGSNSNIIREKLKIFFRSGAIHRRCH